VTWILVLYLPFLLAFVLATRKPGARSTPLSLFVFFNSVQLAGTAIVADSAQPLDVRYCWLIFGMTVLTCVAGTVLMVSHGRLRPSLAPSAPGRTPWTVELVCLYVLSALVTVVYYRAVGHVTVLDAITANPGYDAATARLNSYSGVNYVAPGYANQFKNAIFPTLSVVLINELWMRKLPGRLVVSGLIGVAVFIALAGTGQRGALVIFMLAALVAARASGKLTGRSFVLLGGTVFALFSIVTVLIGRGQAQYVQTQGLMGHVQFFVGALLKRVFVEQSDSGLAGFRYTQGLPTANGREWLSDFMGILPGQPGSDLANRIYATVFGTLRGTDPPSNWGSVQYNFGIVGLVAVGAVIVFIYYVVSRNLFFRRDGDRSLNFLQILALSGFTVSTGSWIAGSPMTILNQGALAYLLLYWLGSRASRFGAGPQEAKASAHEPGVGRPRGRKQVASSGREL